MWVIHTKFRNIYCVATQTWIIFMDLIILFRLWTSAFRCHFSFEFFELRAEVACEGVPFWILPTKLRWWVAVVWWCVGMTMSASLRWQVCGHRCWFINWCDTVQELSKASWMWMWVIVCVMLVMIPLNVGCFCGGGTCRVCNVEGVCWGRANSMSWSNSMLGNALGAPLSSNMAFTLSRETDCWSCRR